MPPKSSIHPISFPPHFQYLAGLASFSNLRRVSVLLRFVGVMNAAVWFGAAVFFFFGVTPATYSDDMKLLLTDRSFSSYSGIIDHIYWQRFFILQICCGAVALAHQCAEWLYLGRRLRRLSFWLVMGLFSLSLVDGIWLQPHLQKLHEIKFAYHKNHEGFQNHNYSAEQRLKAAKSLQFWEKISTFGSFGLDSRKFSMTMNWLALGCLAVLAWRVVNPVESLRFVPTSKFRS